MKTPGLRREYRSLRARSVLTRSKTWRFGLAAFCLLVSVLCPLALAQSYSIDWATLDGGGGTSAGGVYSVSGTVGQPDAGGLMAGASYTLQGGFWPGLVVPATGDAPALFIQFSGANLIVSWPGGTSDYVLEETDSLSAPAWSAAPGGNPTAAISPSGSARFYRLRKR
jgi:hypothetical protein